MSLARLLEQATPGPWWYRIEVGDEWYFGGRNHDGTPGMQVTIRTDERPDDAIAVGAANTDRDRADARLVALAPDVAQLLIDIFADDGTTIRPSLLARYLKLDGEAKDTT